MQTPREFLAARILTERKVVSYRTLTRYLGINVNKAKRLLQDFYFQEISKNPGSIHSTYLIAGERMIDASAVNERWSHDDAIDTHLRSSPFLSSSVLLENKAENQITHFVMSLVNKENLEVVKAKYQHISSFHIYSLSPSLIQNLQILADENKSLTLGYIVNDPVDRTKQYGAIQNMAVQEFIREPPTLVTASISKTVPVKSLRSNSHQDTKKKAQRAQYTGPFSLSTKPKIHNESDLDDKSQGFQKVAKATTNEVHDVKGDPSNIFKSFSQPTQPKANSDPVISEGLAQTASEIGHLQSEDSIYQRGALLDDVSEDEIRNSSTSRRTFHGIALKSIKQRTEHLRQMMEVEDDDVDASVRSLDPAVHAGQEPDVTTNTNSPNNPPIDPQGVSLTGHRRGRRQVIKKKMLKDEEGYLVTKEEPSWESFSEEESPIPKGTMTIPDKASSSRGRKTGGKGQAQGNIKSFFGQK